MNPLEISSKPAGRGALPGLRHLFDAADPRGALARGSAGTLRATQGAHAGRDADRCGALLRRDGGERLAKPGGKTPGSFVYFGVSGNGFMSSERFLFGYGFIMVMAL